MKLNQSCQVNISNDLITRVAEKYSITVHSWDKAAHGIGNIVIHVTDTSDNEYFLKFYNSTHLIIKTEREVNFCRRLSEYQIPVPTFVSNKEGRYVERIIDKSGEHAITVSHAMPGNHPVQYSDSLLKELSRYHALLHCHTPEDSHNKLDIASDYTFYDILPSDPKQLQDLSISANASLARLNSVWNTLPKGLSHLDISHSNILVDDGVISGIIDFEDLTEAPLIFCLGGTLWDIYDKSGGSWEQVEKYLMGYTEQRDLTDDEKHVLSDIVLSRGWIALHGTLLTQPNALEKISNQINLLQRFTSDINQNIYEEVYQNSMSHQQINRNLQSAEDLLA